MAVDLDIVLKAKASALLTNGVRIENSPETAGS
jgi:hypothetical protein